MSGGTAVPGGAVSSAKGDAEDAVWFPLRFGRLRLLCLVFGMTSGTSGVSIGDDRVEVRAGPWFRTRFPRPQLVAVEASPARPWAIGVHTWRDGTWIVNGAAAPMARLVLAGPVDARTLGFPVHPRRIEVSVTIRRRSPTRWGTRWRRATTARVGHSAQRDGGSRV